MKTLVPATGTCCPSLPNVEAQEVEQNLKAGPFGDRKASQQQQREEAQSQMAGGMINGGKCFPRRLSGRPIPKRGQVKVAVVLVLANSVAGIFSRTTSCVAHPHLTH
ncbi:hypothetical protein E2542_SST00372 [Spatholobus suberectus]|nr:hypothetical protein E2542_SST00372 [Spatholobus suberectus]